EDLPAQALDDAAAHVAHEVGLGEIADAAADEDGHERDRDQIDHPRIGMQEGSITKALGQPREGRRGRGVDRAAQDAEGECSLVRLQIPEQPPIGDQHAHRLAGPAAGPVGPGACHVVQGAPAPSSLMVAMFSRTKPSWPSTSIAVTTDCWVARPSARMVTVMLRLLPACLSSAERRVSALELMSSRPLTR